ncbi:MAG: ATP-binding cassette domain-containing protein [Desulfobacterales bacterium]|nr:ATP-binding cassette domain-containing protein [Desulfobacterales bacterium]
MEPLLCVKDLKKYFTTSRGILKAVDGVSLALEKGQTVGLVGESGCGKSTLGKSIMRLTEPTSGNISFEGIDVLSLSKRELRPFRKRIQYIFQDPFSSLNPRSTVQRILKEPLIVHGVKDKTECKNRIEWLMNKVGLGIESLKNYPHEFSGGQRQRIGIARALALNPSLIICDEPVSALDVSIQAQILNLLSKLQRELGLSYLFISHDLSVVKYISDIVMVMYLGKIVEVANHAAIWSEPLHPYTQILMSSAPLPDPVIATKRHETSLKGDVPSPLNVPSGCRFRTRCPIAVKSCSENEPALREVRGDHFVACDLVVTR